MNAQQPERLPAPFLPQALQLTIIDGIMANYPEAGRGEVLQCYGWQYSKRIFHFEDTVTGKTYVVNQAQLLAALPLLFTDKYPRNCTAPPHSSDPEPWDLWLCDSDAIDYDAFIQLCILGSVDYD